MIRDRRRIGPGGTRPGAIAADVAAALRGYLERQGMAPASARDLVAALSTDMADGVGESIAVLDRLVAAAAAENGGRIEAMAGEIARLGSIVVAPEA